MSELTLVVIIIFFGIRIIFGDYIQAHVELIRERAREKEIANDESEYFFDDKEKMNDKN